MMLLRERITDLTWEYVKEFVELYPNAFRFAPPGSKIKKRNNNNNNKSNNENRNNNDS